MKQIHKDIKVLTAFFALLPLVLFSGIKFFMKAKNQIFVKNDMWE